MACTRRKAACFDCSWQRTESRKDPGSCQNSECIIEEFSVRCCNGDGPAKNHMKKFAIAVLKGLKRETDFVKAIGSMKVGDTCEEPNVRELDEYAEELPHVFDTLDPGLSECVEKG